MIEHNGKLYTTVTEAIKFVSGLGHIPKEILDKAGDRGTRTHSAITSKLKGLGDWGIDEDIQGYVTSADKILPQIGKIYHIEERFFNDGLLLTGQVDLIAEYEGMPTLIDWKTSSKANDVTWCMQAAAYIKLTHYQGNDALFVKLDRKGGDPELHFYSTEQLEDAWQKFMLCFEVHKLFFANKNEEVI
jgi:hypothetical protein